MPPSDQGRLDNWKDIANYLHRDIRTVQRWEKYEGLPVHRHPGRKSRIFAYESEIAEWWKNRETLAPPGEAAAPNALQESIGRPSVPVNWLASALVLICIMAGILLFGGLMQPIPPGHTMDVPDRIFAAADCEGGIVRNVFVKGQPIQLVLSPDLHSLYVLNNVASVGVQVIDLDRYVLSEQIDIPGGVSSIALDRDGATLYLGTLRDGLHIVSRKTGQTRVVRDGISSVVRDLALTRDGKRLYLTLETGGLKRLDLPEHRLATVWTDRCPEFLAMDPAGQYLYVSCGCGPGQSRTHDTIEVMDLATETTVRVLKGPPMVVGSIHLFARGDKLWADGRDACQNQRYRNEAMECPVFPGTIQNIFRLSDSSLVKMIGKPATNPMSDPTFTEDGTRAIAGGIPVRVLDTTFYLERETFARDHTELLGPVIDPRRKRMYVAGFTSNRVYGLDLPLRDCGPPGVALGHLWPGDGTLTDHAGVTQMSTDGEAAFEPGLVGRAFKVDRTVLQAETQYTGLDAFAGLDGSIEMWVKMTDVTGGTIVEFLESKKSLWKLAADPDLHLRFTQGNSPAVRSASPIHLNLWQNLALVARGPHLMIYVNGQASIETTRLKEGLEGVRSLRLGPFSGLIDEVAMYDRPLSAGEIKGLIRSIPDCTGVAHTVK